MTKIGQGPSHRKLDRVEISSAFKCEVNGNFLPVNAIRGAEVETRGHELRAKRKLALGRAIKPAGELAVDFYLDGKDSVVSQIANSIANQTKAERYTITITEMAKDKSVVKTFNYGDCLLTSLDFPTITAGSGELLTMRATFKPTRLTVS